MVIRILVAAVLALALVGCGGGEDDPAPAVHTASNGDVYNDADVEFATAMIQQHAEAIGLVVAAADRPLDGEARRLADRIRDTQVPEVEQMITWLTAWDQEIPETSLDHVNAGHGHESGSEAVEELRRASDAEFQDRWLELMIEQHEAAVGLAETEQQDGRYDDAVTLAETIEQTQAEDVETMQDLLGD